MPLILSHDAKHRESKDAGLRIIAEEDSILSVRPLHPLVALLRLETERRDRPGLEPLQADRLVRLLAISVGAVLDPLEGGVDLGDQLALAVARAKLQRPLGLERSAIGDVGLREALFLEVDQGLAGFFQ